MTAIPPLEETVSRRVQYLRVFILGFSAFIFNTTEFVPVGLLSDIADSFTIAPAQVGWMLTIYAWIVALMSLPMMLLTRNFERKTLLLSLFVLFNVSHLLTVFAWSYGALLVSRIGIAFAHAIFWSITASIAIRVAPPGKETFALSVLATGTGLAMVLGVPVGRIIGQWLGWRVTFAVITVIAIVVAVSLFSLLPKLPSLFSGSLSKVPEILKNRILLGMYLFIFVIFSAHYTAYSYIEPFLQQIGLVSEHFTTLILLLFGVAGIAGSILFSQLGDRANTLMLVISSVVVSFCMLSLFFTVQHSTWLIVVILLWGAAIMIIGLSMQIKVLSIDNSAADIIMSLYSGIINLGIGAGALMGGQAILLMGLPSVGFSGAALGVLALAILIILFGAIRDTR
ncbi:sugar transporter [Marinomonas posidonica]|uniref:Major facilitator superfamily MFS_1 n=1 Tax=Marinomonas posidonica (strain CECT 7376 / NCIMB 14433 / IVIA-Po-181) TaxID=491952 RepID=F6D0V7_MARPP|nr:sugar transporter [Marinomonas posidonica]AEF55989.1 major facilitator superfamily MFS_1 [Marinomonas posidonica IVIA-Po-181]